MRFSERLDYYPVDNNLVLIESKERFCWQIKLAEKAFGKSEETRLQVE